MALLAALAAGAAALRPAGTPWGVGLSPAGGRFPPAPPPARQSSSRDAVLRISLQTPQGRVELAQGEAGPAGASGWQVVSPCCWPAEEQRVRRLIRWVQAIPGGVRVQQAVRPDEMERFGLLRPAARLELVVQVARPAGLWSDGAAWVAPVRRVVHVSDAYRLPLPDPEAPGPVPPPPGETQPLLWRFVRISGDPWVYRVPAEQVEALLWALPGLWQRRRIMGLQEQDIERLAVFGSGRRGPVLWTRQGDRWVALGGSPQWQRQLGQAEEADQAEQFVEALVSLEGHLQQAQAASLERLRQEGRFGEPSLEVLVAARAGAPTWLVVEGQAPLAASWLQEEKPVGEVEPWSVPARPPLRQVYVEQGTQRLLFWASSDALGRLEAKAAPWTALPSDPGPR